MNKLLLECVGVSERSFHKLEKNVEPPKYVQRGSHYVFRYQDESIEAAIIQKLARIVSSLYAMLVLSANGLFQEVGATCRMLDEFGEDLHFLCLGVKPGPVTDLHERYLAAFYEEEFDKPDNPRNSTQNRPMIPRQKIQATIANAPCAAINPSDGQAIQSTIFKADSGYVHGASIHIMEMIESVNGGRPYYRLSGMLGTQREPEWLAQSWHYCYRGLLYVMEVAGVFDERDLLQELYAYRSEIEVRSGRTDWPDPEKLVREHKKQEKA
jgi:hypothetical protein